MLIYRYYKKVPQFNHVPIEECVKTGVYIIRHLDYKPESIVYVGSTGVVKEDSVVSGFRIRWKSHLSDLRHGYHHARYLQNVCNKYGIDNLKFDILEICDTNIEERENYWITEFDSYKKGYNSKREAGKRGTGFKMYDEIVDRRRLNYARYDLEGTLIDTWRGLSAIQKKLGISFNRPEFNSSNYSAGGYLWRKYNDTPKEKIEPYKDRTLMPVLCYGLDGKFIKEYSKTMDAVNDTGVPNGNISKAIRLAGANATHVACGYQWYPYTKNYPLQVEPFILKTGHQKKVRSVNIQTGEELIHNSIRQMTDKIKVSRSQAVKNLLSGKNEITTKKLPVRKYIIEYV